MKSYKYPNFDVLENIKYSSTATFTFMFLVLEKRTSSTSPGTMVHVMHVLFVLFAVFENLKAYFSEVYTPVHTQNIFIENATNMV